jgi:hypothetical protein
MLPEGNYLITATGFDMSGNGSTNGTFVAVQKPTTTTTNKNDSRSGGQAESSDALEAGPGE